MGIGLQKLFLFGGEKITGVTTACLLVDSFLIVALSRVLHVIDLDAQSKMVGEKTLKTSICALAAFEGLIAAGTEDGSVFIFEGPELKQRK